MAGLGFNPGQGQVGGEQRVRHEDLHTVPEVEKEEEAKAQWECEPAEADKVLDCGMSLWCSSLHSLACFFMRDSTGDTPRHIRDRWQQ